MVPDWKVYLSVSAKKGGVPGALGWVLSIIRTMINIAKSLLVLISVYYMNSF
jgi:hypothetical protein